MTIVAGYVQSPAANAALDLAATLADGMDEVLAVATVTPIPWQVPSIAKVDSEYAHWIREFSDSVAASARERLGGGTPHLPPDRVSFTTVGNSSASRGLVQVAESAGRPDETLLVIGSGEGQVGQIVAGSTTTRLLHSSPVPVAVAPRGYRAPSKGFPRVTCAYSGIPGQDHVVRGAAALAARLGASLRVVTFAVRRRGISTSDASTRFEDEMLQTQIEQAHTSFDALTRRGVIDDDTDTVVGTGTGWRAAIDDVEWNDGDILVIGSSPSNPLSRVFVGSRAEKLMRHSPVPVVVLPNRRPRPATAA